MFRFADYRSKRLNIVWTLNFSFEMIDIAVVFSWHVFLFWERLLSSINMLSLWLTNLISFNQKKKKTLKNRRHKWLGNHLNNTQFQKVVRINEAKHKIVCISKKSNDQRKFVYKILNANIHEWITICTAVAKVKRIVCALRIAHKYGFGFRGI